MSIYYPNFYTDDEWNDLSDSERRQSDAMPMMEREDIEQRLKELEEDIRDFGEIRGSDDYADMRMLQREVEFWQQCLSESGREAPAAGRDEEA